MRRVVSKSYASMQLVIKSFMHATHHFDWFVQTILPDFQQVHCSSLKLSPKNKDSNFDYFSLLTNCNFF